MHVHLKRGGLQTLQVDDAVLGAADFDIIHSEEAVTGSICLEGNRLQVISQAKPCGLPKLLSIGEQGGDPAYSCSMTTRQQSDLTESALPFLKH